jgi:predicted TPR repeat methyltransferase
VSGKADAAARAYHRLLEADPAGAVRQWHQLVEAFAARGITFAGDG